MTVVRRVDAVWEQVCRSATSPSARTVPKRAPKHSQEGRRRRGSEAPPVSAIAAEPGSGDAWIALGAASGPRTASALTSARARHIAADGRRARRADAPSQRREQAAGVGPEGLAIRIVCPAGSRRLLARHQRGLAFPPRPEGGRASAGRESDEERNERLLRRSDHQRPAARPGLPQEVAAALPRRTPRAKSKKPPTMAARSPKRKSRRSNPVSRLPLLTDLHSRLVHGRTLELRFHLAVKARVRLLAERHKKLVASTPMRTLAAGNRKLLLQLNRHEWPTKLSLQTHPLAPLPTTTVKEWWVGPNTEAGDQTRSRPACMCFPPCPPRSGWGGSLEPFLVGRPAGVLARRAHLAGAALAATAVALGLLGPGRALPAAGLGSYPQPPTQPTPRQQAELGVPAEAVTLIGASPEEPGAPGSEETWGLGEARRQSGAGPLLRPSLGNRGGRRGRHLVRTHGGVRRRPASNLDPAENPIRWRDRSTRKGMACWPARSRNPTQRRRSAAGA